MSNSVLNIIEKDNGICINNSKFFLSFSDFEVSDGIDIIENINILKKDYKFEKLAQNAEVFNNFKGSYIAQGLTNFKYFINIFKNVEIFSFISNDLEIDNFRDNLKAARYKKGFNNARIDIGHVIYINRILSPKILLKIYKTLIKVKVKFFESLRLPSHISNILNKNDFLAVLANVPEETFEEENIYENSVDIINNQYEDDNFEEFILEISENFKSSLEDNLEKLNLNFGILDYLLSENIQIKDLVDAGMELLEGVALTNELKEKLENQIIESLSNINVIALLMAAIRTEDDLVNGRLHEIDISDDPAYFYSDEVLGLAISNQIAGTKAIFNFKRYDEYKPGIIHDLGPMLDDILAGLIAGCMSKIFEE